MRDLKMFCNKFFAPNITDIYIVRNEMLNNETAYNIIK